MSQPPPIPTVFLSPPPQSNPSVLKYSAAGAEAAPTNIPVDFLPIARTGIFLGILHSIFTLLCMGTLLLLFSSRADGRSLLAMLGWGFLNVFAAVLLINGGLGVVRNRIGKINLLAGGAVLSLLTLIGLAGLMALPGIGGVRHYLPAIVISVLVAIVDVKILIDCISRTQAGAPTQQVNAGRDVQHYFSGSACQESRRFRLGVGLLVGLYALGCGLLMGHWLGLTQQVPPKPAVAAANASASPAFTAMPLATIDVYDPTRGLPASERRTAIETLRASGFFQRYFFPGNESVFDEMLRDEGGYLINQNPDFIQLLADAGKSGSGLHRVDGLADVFTVGRVVVRIFPDYQSINLHENGGDRPGFRPDIRRYERHLSFRYRDGVKSTQANNWRHSNPGEFWSRQAIERAIRQAAPVGATITTPQLDLLALEVGSQRRSATREVDRDQIMPPLPNIVQDVDGALLFRVGSKSFIAAADGSSLAQPPSLQQRREYDQAVAAERAHRSMRVLAVDPARFVFGIIVAAGLGAWAGMCLLTARYREPIRFPLALGISFPILAFTMTIAMGVTLSDKATRLTIGMGPSPVTASVLVVIILVIVLSIALIAAGVRRRFTTS